MSLQLLAIHKESQASESISLPEGSRTIRVGRVEDNDVQIDHTSISAKHALLKSSESNGVEIVDCNSSNGTFVNGVRIDRTELQVGDIVKFAYLSYRVVDPKEDGEPVSNSLDADPAVPESPETKPEEAILKTDEEVRDSSEKEKSLKSEIQGQGQRVEDLEKDPTELQKKLEEAESRIAEREERIEALRNESRERFELLTQSETVKEQQEKDFRKLSEEHENMLRELATVREERDAFQVEAEKNQAEKSDFATKLQEVSSVAEEVSSGLRSESSRREELEKELANRTRERDDLGASLEKARNEVQLRSAELLERDQVIAAGQFESDRLAREFEKSEAHAASLESDCLQWQDAYEALKANFEKTTGALEESLARETTQQERLNQFFGSFREHLVQLHQDWDYWKVSASLKGSDRLESIEDCFSEAEELRCAIRSELDAIEPIWEKYGNRVEAELKTEIADLESQITDLDSNRDDKAREVEALTEDVRGLREKVDVEVRRAQGLSRSGVQIEIPERFESMVIAQDRERQILLSLVGSLEFLEELITGYRRSKKLREVVFELDEFAKRIIAILEANGVKEFTVEPGTELNLKHRKEVKILERKGWGTREYGEQPFHPGTVKKVVRSGYRAGQGEGSVLLRKVEVLIRDAEV